MSGDGLGPRLGVVRRPAAGLAPHRRAGDAPGPHRGGSTSSPGGCTRPAMSDGTARTVSASGARPGGGVPEDAAGRRGVAARGVRGGQDRGAAGKISGEADDVIRVLSTLVSILIAVLLEKTTHRRQLRPCAVADGQGRAAQGRQRQGPEAEPADGRQPLEDHRRGDGRRRGLRPRWRRGCRPGASYDIVFEVIERRIDAEVKECPDCRGRFPETMPGPLQYGVGLQAFVINLPVAQMLSLRRRAGAGGLRAQALRGHLPRLRQAPA